MSKEQIEEMVKVIEQAKHDMWVGECPTYAEHSQNIAKYLYNAGYRKQVEGEWIAKDNFNGRCTIATCSKCGVEKAFPVLVRIETILTLYPYCQMCGVHMKGAKE